MNLKHCIFLWFALLPHLLFAQNFVPNYDFEQYSSCPSANGQIYKAIPWFQPCTYFGNIFNSSPSQYYNECGTDASVPNNSVGFQYSYSGNGYVGIDFYHTDTVANPNVVNHRGYLEVKLNDSLQANKKYCFEMYMSLADSSNYSILNIDVLFTNDSVLDTNFYKPLPYSPQITNSNNIVFSDTANWKLFTGIYIAQGGEKFITIGNFDNDSNTVLIPAQGTGFYGEDMAYYYIDNVSLTLCDTTAVEDLQVSDYKFQVIPNPASAEVRISVNAVEPGDFILTVSDITGRKVQEYYFAKNNLIIPTGEFDNGIYFLSLYKNGDFIATEKLIIVR